jgi:hypothetical protein
MCSPGNALYLLVQVSQSSGDVPMQQHAREKSVCRELALYAILHIMEVATLTCLDYIYQVIHFGHCSIASICA